MSKATQRDDIVYLYRWFDKDGRLLYVGISTDPVARGRAHRKTSWWYQWAVRMTVDPAGHPRVVAERFEQRAIGDERPIFNGSHAPGRDQRGRDYLRELGLNPDDYLAFGEDKEPLYRRISNSLREEIESGGLPAGSPIPSEASLAQIWATSRPTARQALHDLRASGLTLPGVGNANDVVRRRDAKIVRTADRKGHRFSVDVRLVGETVWLFPRQDVLDRLGAAPDEVVRRTSGSLIHEDRAVGLTTSWTRTSVLFGKPRTQEVVSLRTSSLEEQAALGIAAGFPVGCVSRYASIGGQAVEITDIVIPADRYALEYDIPVL